MKSEPCLGSFIDSGWNDHKFFPHTRRGLEGPPCHSPLSCSTSFSHCGDTWPLPLISSLSLSLVPFSFGLNRLSRPFSHLSFSISCFPCLCLSVIDTYCIFNLILSSSVPFHLPLIWYSRNNLSYVCSHEVSINGPELNSFQYRLCVSAAPVN